MRALKNTAIFAILLVVSISLPGCSFLKDKNSKLNEPRAMKMGAKACLKDTKAILRNYIDGTEKVERVEGVLDCLVTAVNTFTSKTTGKSSADGYTLEEIQRFIIDYFKDENGFSSKLLSIGFEIKSTAVGGRSTNITRVEIEKVKAIILEIKKGVRELDPHMDILLGRLPTTTVVSAASVNNAVLAMNKFTDKLSTKFEGKEGGTLEISKVFELVKTLKGPELSAKFEKYSVLANHLKAILINGPEEKIRCDEWPSVFKAAARMYGIAVRHKYGLAQKTLGKGETVQAASAIMNEVASLLKEGASRRAGGIISSKTLHDLLVEYEKINGQLMKNIKLSSLETLYPKIFTHVLRPSRIAVFPDSSSIEAGRPLGIGSLELQALQYYTLNYITGLNVARDLFKDRDSRSSSDLVAEIRENLEKLEVAKPKVQADVARWITHKLVLKTFLSVLNPAQRPLLYSKVNAPHPNAKLRAPFIGNVDYTNAPYTHNDLIRLNTTRLMVELVLRSFTAAVNRTDADINRARTLGGLTTGEAEVLYRDMRKVGFDLGVADPRSQRAGHRTFMEANLFMSNSNGDNYISYREGVEWYNFVSASGAHALEIFNSAHEEWLLKPEAQASQSTEDVFGRLKVDINSFRTHFKNNFGNYFSNLPGMARFVESLKKQPRDCGPKAEKKCGGSLDKTWYGYFEEAIENASRPLGHTDHKMDSAAMRTVVPIIYYTESIFNRFDKNKDGILDNKEAWTIFPIMKSTITLVSNGAADTELKQQMVFAGLLLKGEPPPDDWRKFVSIPLDAFKEWRKKPTLNRLGIINLVSTIATTSRNNAVNGIKAIFESKKGSIASEFRDGWAVLNELHELSRCSPDSLDRFRFVMQKQAGYIFAPTEKGQQYNGDTFVRRLQRVIQADRPTQRDGLHEQCQPMLRL